MSRPPINVTHPSATLHMAQCHDGYWLYDDTRNMNLAIRAESEQDALVQAVMYYQKRLLVVEAQHKALHETVEGFLSDLRRTNDDAFGLTQGEEWL